MSPLYSTILVRLGVVAPSFGRHQGKTEIWTIMVDGRVARSSRTEGHASDSRVFFPPRVLALDERFLLIIAEMVRVRALESHL